MYSSNQSRQLYVVDENHTLTVETFKSVDHIGKYGVSIKYTDTTSGADDTQLVDVFEDCDIRYMKAAAAPTLYGRTAAFTVATPPSAGGEAYLTLIAPGYYGDTLENKEVFPINVTVAASASASTVATDIVNFINNSKSISKHFKASASSATVTIYEKFNPKEHVTGKYQIHSMLFYVENGHFIDNAVTDHLSDAYTPSLWTSAGITYGKSNGSVAGTSLNGSYELAHLEWFCHGFRGDVYRGMAYPDDIPFTPLIVPAANAQLYTCDIHYFWHGYGNQVDKSEKVLTFVGSQSDMEAIVDALTSISKADAVTIPEEEEQGGGN